MPKVDRLLWSGYALWFNSNDHAPPHFHLEKVGAWEVRVFFLLDQENCFEIRYGPGPTGGERRRFYKEIMTHREQLLTEWERKVCTQP